MATAAANGTAVREIYAFGGADGATPVSALFGAPLAEQVPVSPDDVVVLPYLSGTTGINKGVRLTHRNLVAKVAQVIGTAKICRHDKLIAVLPFFHIYGCKCS